MRLIDADERKQQIESPYTEYPIIIQIRKALKDFIDDAPTIDAVPVVRCKDCIHWGMNKRLNVPWCFKMHIDKSEEGYCDSGERREE